MDELTKARIIPGYKPQPYTFIEQLHRQKRNYNVAGCYNYINAVEEFENDEMSGNITFETSNKPRLSELRLKLLELSCEFGEEAKISIGADYIFAVDYPVLFDLKKEQEIPNSRGRKADWYWGFKQAVEQRISLKNLITRENEQGKVTYSRTLKTIFVEGYVEGCIYKFDESEYCQGVLSLIKHFRDLKNTKERLFWFDSEFKAPENACESFKSGWKDAVQMLRLTYYSYGRHQLDKKNPLWGTGSRIDRLFSEKGPI